MNFFKNFDWSFKSIAKVFGLVLLGAIALSLAISLISFAVKTIFNVGQSGYSGVSPTSSRGGYFNDVMQEDAFTPSAATMSYSGKIMPPIEPRPDFTSGTDAEDFEVKTYDGTIRTRHLDENCDAIAGLKSREDVIFEDSNKNEESCSYRFKVKKEQEAEIAALIEGMDPEVFNANITSIKRAVEGVDTELDILQKKLASIEETLAEALESYDDISAIATRQSNAETLAKIIDSKLNLIERLTNERLNIKSQIEYANKAKIDQVDQLNFTFFTINIYKDVIFDWKQIKENWKYESKQLVENVNDALQAMTLNLATYLVRFVQVVIYLFISLFLLKFVWLGVKKIWKGEFNARSRR